MSKRQVSQRLTKKDVREVVLEAIDKGWTAQMQKHGVHLKCPCGDHMVGASGTPQNPDREARRVRRQLIRASCWPLPD